MKKLNKIKFFGVLVLAGSLVVGCTKDFQNINTDPKTITNLTTNDYGRLLAFAQTRVFNAYQTGQNLHADIFAQYFTTTSTNFSQDRYVMNVSHLSSGLWSPAYTSVFPELDMIIAGSPANSPEAALAQIWRVYQFHRVTDYWGPVPYSSVGTDAISYAYDGQDKIYYDMLKRLADAALVLSQNLDKKPFSLYDGIYKGDAAKWLKFANTLRLRLAMRISDVDPARAKTEAEAAVASGVMTDNTDNAFLARSTAASDFNAFNNITGYNEFRMSATMESYLKGFNDPRLSQFFRPAIATGTYEGIRNGLLNSEKSIVINSNNNNSNVGLRYDVSNATTTPQDVMHTAEAYFLRAEGALKGWNMGATAQVLYEQGISISLNQWGITDNTAINNYVHGVTAPVAPLDYFNSPAVATTPVQWSATDETRKEQINVQKWLAVYPDGHEAWANQRRSGYPKLYPVVHSDNPDLPQGTFIKRVIYTATERATNAAALDNAISTLLGGPDNCATPLWWDKF